VFVGRVVFGNWGVGLEGILFLEVAIVCWLDEFVVLGRMLCLWCVFLCCKLFLDWVFFWVSCLGAEGVCLAHWCGCLLFVLVLCFVCCFVFFIVLCFVVKGGRIFCCSLGANSACVLVVGGMLV